jgi:hypothetical protein
MQTMERGVKETGGAATLVVDLASLYEKSGQTDKAIALYDDPPGAGPLNVWKTTVDLIEDLGMTVRILTGAPLPLTVEVTNRTGSRLSVGDTVWVAIKATEIGVEPAG